MLVVMGQETLVLLFQQTELKTVLYDEIVKSVS